MNILSSTIGAMNIGTYTTPNSQKPGAHVPLVNTPRCSTPVQLGMREYSEHRHIVKPIATGGYNIVHFVQDSQGQAILGAIKEPKQRSVLSSKGQLGPEHRQKNEVALRCMIEGQLTPEGLKKNSALKNILDTFNLTTDAVLRKLILNTATTKSKFHFPDKWVAAMPAVTDAKELFDHINALLGAEKQTAKERKPLIKNTLTGCRDVMVMLSILHACGVVHCDLKPENILINRDGEGYIIDYDFSKRITVDPICVNVTRGTLEYMPPEVLQKKPPISYPADLFSAGFTIALAMLGIYRDSDDHFRLNQYKTIEDSFTEALSSDAVKRIKTLVYSMTRNEPAERISAFEAAVELDALCKAHGFLEGEPVDLSSSGLV